MHMGTDCSITIVAPWGKMISQKNHFQLVPQQIAMTIIQIMTVHLLEAIEYSFIAHTQLRNFNDNCVTV